MTQTEKISNTVSPCLVSGFTIELNQIKSSQAETLFSTQTSKERHCDLLNGDRMVFNGTGVRQI